jgi:uncharacterized protein
MNAEKEDRMMSKRAHGNCLMVIFILILVGTSFSCGRDEVSKIRRAAEKGEAAAQNTLGNLYLEGTGVAKNEAEALSWYRKAADQGDPVAQCNLGSMYAEGIGVPKDAIEAANWFRKSAEQSNTVGQLCLGIMYRDGAGVPQDNVQSYLWLSLASPNSPAAKAEVDKLQAKMRPEQIAEAKKLAEEWKPKK